MTEEITITSFLWERLPCLAYSTVNKYQPGIKGQACACGKTISLWDYIDVSPSAPSYDCLENPKHHRHPDWIAQEEELELFNDHSVWRE